MARRTCSLCLGIGIIPLGEIIIPCVDCVGNGYIEYDDLEDTESEQDDE